jgi:hypothetical protein
MLRVDRKGVLLYSCGAKRIDHGKGSTHTFHYTRSGIKYQLDEGILAIDLNGTQWSHSSNWSRVTGP